LHRDRRRFVNGSGFSCDVRVKNVEQARAVLRALRQHEGHRFPSDDVSLADPDIRRLVGHRQVTDAHLLALARRNDTRLLTFDAGGATLARGDEVELLTALGRARDVKPRAARSAS
jgi:predicted nucleic acid-binding protein